MKVRARPAFLFCLSSFIKTSSRLKFPLFCHFLLHLLAQALLLREYKNGTYSLLPFYLATLLNAIVFNVSARSPPCFRNIRQQSNN